MALPQLTEEQRAAALEKAAAARRARAELKERLKRGGTTLAQVLEDAEKDEVLGKMKSNAVVVNVGRGQLVVTDDLVAALRDGVIAGAAMDVTEPEPLPENHPLWRMPNATITPHIAATARIARKMIAPQIVDNAAAFEAGERMPTEVDVEAGY